MYKIKIIYRGELIYIYGYSVADACRRQGIDPKEIAVLCMKYID